MQSHSNIHIRVPGFDVQVSGILTVPDNPVAGYLFAHGAGAGMEHAFMTDVTNQLTNSGIAVLRFNFPYMEAGRRSPDRPPKAQAAILGALDAFQTHVPKLPLFIGGKSFGGRMSSGMVAESGDSRVRGLVFFGFPLHAPGKASLDRAEHLKQVQAPMLFLQGERDKLADIALMQQLNAELPNSTMIIYPMADHSFKAPKKSGYDYLKMVERLGKDASDWMKFKV